MVSVILIISSLLSLIQGLSYWYSKIFDFPRVQYLLLSLVCLIAFAFLNRKWGFSSILLSLGLISTITIQAILILPYFWGDKQVPDASSAAKPENSVSILISNVLITNRESADFLQIVDDANPDLLLVMEVDEWWVTQLNTLKEEYAYVIEYPLDNAYGMALYSKLPLKDSEIMFLKHDDVPSFHATVILPSGNPFVFHGVHPVAPVPSEKYPDNKGEEEIALLKVGNIVAADTLPAMVAGDLNDVSWSRTSMLFEEQGKLYNVRIGRGLFNSYNANSFIQRWPLDHFFVTHEFAVIDLKLLPAFGSDHFPVFAKFELRDK